MYTPEVALFASCAILQFIVLSACFVLGVGCQAETWRYPIIHFITAQKPAAHSTRPPIGARVNTRAPSIQCWSADSCSARARLYQAPINSALSHRKPTS